jgi:dienelactone hydrolase
MYHQNDHLQPRQRLLGFAGALAAVLVAVASRPAAGQEPLLWGGLKPGPHAVGYRSIFHFDHTRQYDPDYVTDPTVPPAHKPRPILICVWYPAQMTRVKPMEYRQYLELPPIGAKLAAFAKRLDYNIRLVVSEETVGAAPANRTPAETAAFERFLAVKVLAVKDAPPAPGRFPVVIHHPGLGGTHDDNSVLFELLASNGYVVLSSAYPMADAQSVRIGSDLHCSFRDMEFLARWARELPFADADRLGAMGHSWGAIAVLHWAALPESPLRAFVTLDSGFEYVKVEDCGAEPLVYHMRTNKGNIRAAALRVASVERKADFELLEPHLKFAPRYEAAVASLNHNDYLTHGAVRPALLPEKWPDVMKAQRTGYDRTCQHVLHFFDATLKQDAAARESLKRSIRGAGLDDGFKLRFKPAAPVPPTIRQLADYLKTRGVEKAAELLRSIPDQPELRLAGAATVLIEDGDAKEALAALTFVANQYPTVTVVQIRLAQALALTGNQKGALAAYHKAAELLPGDKTAGKAAETWKYLIDKGLKELGPPGSPPTDR